MLSHYKSYWDSMENTRKITQTNDMTFDESENRSNTDIFDLMWQRF